MQPDRLPIKRQGGAPLSLRLDVTVDEIGSLVLRNAGAHKLRSALVREIEN